MTAVAVVRWPRSLIDQKNLFLSIDLPGLGGGENSLQALNDVIARHVSVGDMRRVDSHDGKLEVTYFVDVNESRKISTLLEDLSETFPGIGVSFIDQNQLPSV